MDGISQRDEARMELVAAIAHQCHPGDKDAALRLALELMDATDEQKGGSQGNVGKSIAVDGREQGDKGEMG